RGHLNVVHRLVNEGARLNIVDKQQRTPLVTAVISSTQNPPLFYQICVVLLQGGADACKNIHNDLHKNYMFSFSFSSY
ncbi:unnamed protein product, partial [Rotaria magnacalcarata]